MSLVSVTKIWSRMLAFVAEQAGLSLTEGTFSHDEAHLYYILKAIKKAQLPTFRF